MLSGPSRSQSSSKVRATTDVRIRHLAKLTNLRSLPYPRVTQKTLENFAASITKKESMTFLEQLKADQAKLTSLLHTECEQALVSDCKDRTIETLHQTYLETIGDAISILHSLIDYVDKKA